MPLVTSIGNINQATSCSVGPTAHYLTDVVLGLGVTDTPAPPFAPSSVNAVVAADAAGAPGYSAAGHALLDHHPG